ncbi:TetR/AcrR family transcriptional regulator [Rhodoplanes roseus]|uniref:TetR family transcriptional regulator n=1 Tax=Rhodoplanes roseus TaxID=29409 RepID=A0A327KV26_9BRAD|nr:TetR/AcrR family transcriptional regulator [Rhodoplanes roseus]RAI42689.1 TetR family transcriptional regulator [Rhodoplanes roseus]
MALGRPRTFDMDHALDQALQVFWRRGYDGASIAELTQAIGIAPPSLYAAFGNKEGLFRKVLERYVMVRTKFWDEALGEPTARAMIERLLHGTADFMTEACNPPGCLLVRGTVACSDMAQDIHQELIARRREGERMVCERLVKAKADGELPEDIDPAEFACYIATVLEGMSIHAAGGATRGDLHKVANMTMRAWPK